MGLLSGLTSSRRMRVSFWHHDVIVDSLCGRFLKPLVNATNHGPSTRVVCLTGSRIWAKPSACLVWVTRLGVYCPGLNRCTCSPERAKRERGEEEGVVCPSCPLAQTLLWVDPTACHVLAWPSAAPMRVGACTPGPQHYYLSIWRPEETSESPEDPLESLALLKSLPSYAEAAPPLSKGPCSPVYRNRKQRPSGRTITNPVN